MHADHLTHLKNFRYSLPGVHAEHVSTIYFKTRDFADITKLIFLRIAIYVEGRTEFHLFQEFKEI